MEGCGYFSQHGVGSFILFPTFVVEVDDSVDNLVSFESVGRDSSQPLAYKQSKVSAHPAHLIPPKDTNEMLQVRFMVPHPKAKPRIPLPTSPPTTPTGDCSDPPIVISDEELITSATKPLTKRMVAAIHES